MNTGMNKYIIYPLLALFAIPFLFTSCKDDDEDSELSDDCYISSLSLGTMKHVVYTKSSTGEDSTYVVTFSGSAYEMSIDQRNLTIENPDSLPVHTRVSAALLNVGFEGVLGWRIAGSDDSWTTFSRSDSLDFTNPLELRVWATGGNSSQTYTLKVNVHQQKGDSTIWNNLGEATALSSIGERKAIIWNDQLVVLGKNSSNTLTYIQHPTATSGEWVSIATTGTDNAEPSTLQSIGDSKLYMSTSDGCILTSTNAVDWSDAGYPTMAGLTLIGASDAYLYALCNGKLYSSNGGDWTEEKLDDDSKYLPTGNLNSVYYTMNNGDNRLMLVGRCDEADPTTAIVWTKTWDEGKEQTETWMYYTPNKADKYRCPLLENLCVVYYDNGLQALGGKSLDGKYAAMDSIFHSKDHGVAWRTYENKDMNVDSQLKATAKTAQYITAAVDDQHFLWIVLDDKVWRGRINRLGFARKDR